MLRAEKLLRLLGEILVETEDIRWDIERGGAVGGDIHLLPRILSQRNHEKILSGNDGRIHQPRERRGLESDLPARLGSNGQRSAQFPSFRKPQGSFVIQLIGREAGRI